MNPRQQLSDFGQMAFFPTTLTLSMDSHIVVSLQCQVAQSRPAPTTPEAAERISRTLPLLHVTGPPATIGNAWPGRYRN